MDLQPTKGSNHMVQNERSTHILVAVIAATSSALCSLSAS